MARAFASVVSAFTLAFAAFGHAFAEPVSASDTQAVRSIVEAQLDAFAADDATRAFSYATQEIREMFATPERFIAMVKSGYPAVYRPASVSFLAPEEVQGSVVQAVHLTDASGALWLAVYRLERQPDRSWRIAGCTLRPFSGKMT